MLKLFGLFLIICVVMVTSTHRYSGHNRADTTTSTPEPPKLFLGFSKTVIQQALELTKSVVHQMIILLDNSGKLTKFAHFIESAKSILAKLGGALLSLMQGSFKTQSLSLLTEHFVNNLIPKGPILVRQPILERDIMYSSE